MTATTSRSNAYQGICRKCGGHVAAQAGLLGPKVNGRWTVEHATCPQTVQPAQPKSSGYLRNPWSDISTPRGVRPSRRRRQDCNPDD